MIQVELHPFWRQDELVKFCQSKSIHVSAHTPLGIPDCNPISFEDLTSEQLQQQHHEPETPFRRSRSVHVPMLKLSEVADIADRHNKTPEQVLMQQPVLEQSNHLQKLILNMAM